MKKNIGLLLVLLLVGIAIYSFIQRETEAQQQITELGYEEEVTEKQAPAFTLETLSGNMLSLADLQGKKVIVNFWATWCAPCRMEMPHLQQYYDQYSEQDNVEIVAINAMYEEQSRKNVEDFVNSFKLTFPVALATEEQTLTDYQVLTIPSTFFIDTNGEMQYHIVGPLDKTTVRDYVKKLN